MKSIKRLCGIQHSKAGKLNSMSVLRAAVEALETRTLLSGVVVNSASDTATGTGVVTLNYALSIANSSTTPTTITFDASVFAKPRIINLGFGLGIDGKEPVTITGPAAGVTIDANQTFASLGISAGAAASFSGITFTGGSSAPGIIENSGNMTLADCTISGNTAGISNGAANSATATLTDCTMSGNSFNSIHNYAGSSVSLSDCTVSGSGGGGIINGGAAGSFTVANSIIAGNSFDASGPFTSEGFNLVGATDGSTGWGFDDFTGTAAHPLDADLGPLASNGGPTQTLLPLAGSPAIDHGDNALVPAGITTDQRGLPRISDGTVDIGAVEVQTAATPPISLTPPTAQSAKTLQSKLFSLGSFTQSHATGPYTVDVHWGDQSPDTTFSVGAAGNIPAAAHDFVYTGNFTVVVSVTDSAGHASNRATFVVGVAGPTPLVINSLSETATGPGVFTLGDAIEVANFSASPTTIEFDSGVFAKPRTITLDGTLLLAPPDPVTITGPAAGLTISAAGPADLAIDSGAAVTLSDITFTGQTSSSYNEGCIQNGGTVSLTDCTISGNATGIVNNGIAKLTDCTFSGNYTGINNYANGSVTIADCTISGNRYGISNIGASVTLANSIVAGNTGMSNPDVSGPLSFGAPGPATVVSLGFNLIGQADGSKGFGFDDLIGTAAKPLDAKLGPLADNGGPTETLLPLAGSPAIDHGDNALVPAGITTDQRGLPRVSNGTVDIGAVEVQVQGTPPLSLTAPGAQSARAQQSKLFALGSFTQSEAAGPYTVDVHWGDGSADSTFSVAAAGKIPAAAHDFVYAGNITVVVTVTDSAGHSSNSATFPVDVTGTTSLVVNSVSDTASGPGVVTLSDAIAIADLSAGPTTITFDGSVFAKPQTITVNNLPLEVSAAGPVTITAPPAGVTISTSLGFQIDKGATFILSGVALTGDSQDIQNDGAATLTDCTLSGLGASNGGAGYGIVNAGDLIVTHSTVSGNVKGVTCYEGTASLNDCIISDNTYGGVLCGGFGPADLTLTDCTVSDNSNGGIVDKFAGENGDVALNDCTVSGNTGGGIDNSTGYESPLTLTDCTVSGNTGGGIVVHAAYGTTTVDDCTISGNTATTAGGGISSTALASDFVVANSIIAGNGAPSDPDADGAFISLGFNLIGKTDGSTGWTSTDLTGTTAKPLNPDLGPLADNGGATFTVLPLPGSPAIGHGSVSLIPKGITTDQRGYARVVSGNVDIGAVELRTNSVVTGTVFYDANGDGIQDNGETGIAGVQVYDDLGDLGYFVAGDPTTLTNATGGYALSEVPVGKDTIRQVRPLGYAQTTPANGAGHLVTVSAGQTVSGQNFGDRSGAAPPATIAGTVFNDANGDGIQDDGETGIAGVQVYLDLGNLGYFVTGDPTTMTNANGTYTLSGLAAGIYIVRQALPLGYVQTSPSRGLGEHVTVSAAQTLSGQNFGDMA